MYLQANSPPAADDSRPLAGVLRTHWMLAICVVCGHENVHAERHRATCPGCGATLNSFQLYRDLQAAGR